MKPITRTIRVVVMIVASFCLLLMNRYAISPKKTAAVVAWPLGIVNPVSVMTPFNGRAFWMSSFSILITTPAITIVVARSIPCFFRPLM